MSKYFKKLIGKRIYLSPYAADEAEIELFTKWVNDFRVTDGIGLTSTLCSQSSEKNFVESTIKPATNRRDFVIIDLATNNLIGNCDLFNIDNINRRAEIGIIIGEEKSRGQGIGGEAINLLLDYAFNYLNLHSVSLSYLASNTPAAKAYAKIGFKEVGRRRESSFINGKYVDDITADILDSEFRARAISAIQNKHL
jgi:RimJ/RimL family protein N-acetyltransferase